MKKIPTPAQIASDPELFASTFLKILNKRKRLMRFQWNPAQRHFHAHRTGRDLILKARQLGFSTYVQGEMFRRAVTSTRSAITLAHDSDTTTKLRLMADRFWAHCRFNDLQPLRKYANASLTTYPEFDSDMTIATAGNIETGRGGTYSDFHGSEVAFWKDAEGIMAGAMQGGDPDVILESTPNGAQGYFFELCMEALDGNGVWKLHFYPWWWDPEYRMPLEPGETLVLTDEEKTLVAKHNLTKEQIKWRREKKKELKEKFPQEYAEDPVACFLVSGQGYFGDVSSCFKAPPNAEYIEGHRYAAGLDFGQSNDFTAMPVFDVTVRQQVDLLHINKMEWSEIRTRIKSTSEKWHLKVILAEKNSIGSVNIEALNKMGVRVYPFTTTNESKANIMSELNEALHGGWQLLDLPEQRHEINSFISKQSKLTNLWQLEAAEGAHDDIVIGDGLAIHNALFGAGGFLELANEENQKRQKDAEANKDKVDEFAGVA